MTINTGLYLEENQFRYEQLVGVNSFRVLRLDESVSDADPSEGLITGRLRHVSLNDYVQNCSLDQYIAISYCWGDPTPVDRIWLDNAAYLPLTASAAYILRRVKRDQDVWIDLVCIDQRNNAEKSNQVAIMWDIFKCAERVEAWLGGPEDDSQFAMQSIFDIIHFRDTTRLTGRDHMFLSKYITERYGLREPPWGAFQKLLDRPWFLRTWIMQEIVAAKKASIICAGEVCDWEDFHRFVLELQNSDHENLVEIQDPESPESRPALPRGIASVKNIERFRRQGKSSLASNLIFTLNTLSKDPRDKVFAILHFSFDTIPMELQPRYDLSVRDVYTKTTEYILCQDQSLLLLHMAGIGWNRNQTDLPSWVPDYSQLRRDVCSGKSSFVHANTLGLTLRGNSVSDLTKVSKLEGLFPTPPAIQVRGIIMDDVRVVCKGMSLGQRAWNRITSESHSDRLEFVSWFNSVCRTLENETSRTLPWFKGKSRYRISHSEAFWCSLLVGLTPGSPDLLEHGLFASRGVAYGRRHFHAFMNLLLHSVASKDGKLNLQSVNQRDLEIAKLFVDRLEQVQDWSIFATSIGYIGRGPPLMTANDRVCLLFGSKTPFIIRGALKKWATKLLPVNVYELVGECYVHGLMRDEVMGNIWNALSVRDIVLI